MQAKFSRRRIEQQNPEAVWIEAFADQKGDALDQIIFIGFLGRRGRHGMQRGQLPDPFMSLFEQERLGQRQRNLSCGQLASLDLRRVEIAWASEAQEHSPHLLFRGDQRQGECGLDGMAIQGCQLVGRAHDQCMTCFQYGTRQRSLELQAEGKALLRLRSIPGRECSLRSSLMERDHAGIRVKQVCQGRFEHLEKAGQVIRLQGGPDDVAEQGHEAYLELLFCQGAFPHGDLLPVLTGQLSQPGDV